MCQVAERNGDQGGSATQDIVGQQYRTDLYGRANVAKVRGERRAKTGAGFFTPDGPSSQPPRRRPRRAPLGKAATPMAVVSNPLAVPPFSL